MGGPSLTTSKMYDPARNQNGDRSGVRWWKFLVILTMLLLVRMANMGLLWHLQGQEIRNRPRVKLGNYVFLGLASEESAKERLLRYSDMGTRSIAMVSYFNLIHPAAYLISNKGGGVFVDLGRLSVYVRSGETQVSFHPEDIVERRWRGTTQAFYFGEAPLAPIFKSLARMMVARTKPGPEISYVIEPMGKMKYIRWSYMIYFYLPLILIVWLSSVYGRGFWISFLYYLGLFLFFDFKHALVTVPFFWFLDFTNIPLSSGAVLVFSLIILLVFIVLALSSFSQWRNLDKKGWARPLVLFFILLALFLRL